MEPWRLPRLWQVCLTPWTEPPYLPVASTLDMAPVIRNRVKELRAARGWTQQQLADAVGVSRQSINSIERERYVPSLPLALTFARLFGCATDDLFALEPPR